MGRASCSLLKIMNKFCSLVYDFPTSASFVYPVMIGQTGMRVSKRIPAALGHNCLIFWYTVSSKISGKKWFWTCSRTVLYAIDNTWWGSFKNCRIIFFIYSTSIVSTLGLFHNRYEFAHCHLFPHFRIVTSRKPSVWEVVCWDFSTRAPAGPSCFVASLQFRQATNC